MANRKFQLTNSEANELLMAFQSCRNGVTKTRFQAVRLYGQGYPVSQIIDACACSIRSLLDWCGAYRQGGIAALTDQRKGGNRARLKPEQIHQLQKQLHQYTPAQRLGKEATGPGDGSYWNVTDIARLIQQEYDVVYESHTSYYQLLAKCGMTYQRPAKQYKSHSASKLMAFEEELEKKTDGRGSGIAGHSDSGGG